jgi:hypothetical protein
MNASWTGRGSGAGLKYQAASDCWISVMHGGHSLSALTSQDRPQRRHAPGWWYFFDRHWWHGEQYGGWASRPQPRHPWHCPVRGRALPTSVWRQRARPAAPPRPRPGPLTRPVLVFPAARSGLAALGRGVR